MPTAPAAPDRGPVLVAAGGTGGHLFPAEALATALNKRDIAVHLVTDRRAARFGGTFAEQTVHVVASATLRARNPIAAARTVGLVGLGLLQAHALLRRLRPAAVIGFGGYPTIPPVLAAVWCGIPTLIHDANAVAGRANRFLAPRVTALAVTFPDVFAHAPHLAAKATLTGNPVRAAVLTAAQTPYQRSDRTMSLIIFGGSQGARIMSTVVPAAMERLDQGLRLRLLLAQQARSEDLEQVRANYARLNISAEVAPFFADLPARIAAAHLVVARSGASTVAELAAIGRPAILVPLPHALDQDQSANAAVLEQAGGAIALLQSAFTPERLARELTALAGTPQRLVAMASAARSGGAIDAAERLADLVLATIASGANHR